MEYKGYRVENLGTFSLIQIRPKGSGDIPDVLKGLFTNRPMAFQAIDRYMDSLLTKRKTKNDKKESPSSG